MQWLSLYVHWFIYGLIMGTAQIIPGISAGSMALLIGIYPRLMHIAAHWRLLFKSPFDDLKRLFALIVGFIGSLLVVSHPLSWMLTHHTSWSYAAFIGFILGSLPSCRQALEPDTLRGKHYIIMVVTGLVAVGCFLCIPTHTALFNNPSLPILALASLFAGSAMILPGISGSWLLLILGCYPIWVNSIKNVDTIPLLTMSLSALAGAALTLYLLSNVFKHHAKSVLCGLFGLMLASLTTLYPYLLVSNENDASLILSLIGATVLSYVVTHMSGRKKN